MNANSTFSIGKDHIVCEDYALSYAGAGLAYAIVSDGCSASPEVDFGSRCLAMAAKSEIRLMKELSWVHLGEDAIRRAQRVRDTFPYLPSQFLDATLLVAWVKDGAASFAMWGDGVIVQRRAKTGWITAHHVQLSSGAPDYLSYELDPLRKQAYEKEFADYVKEVTHYNSANEKDKLYKGSDAKAFQPFVGTSQVEPGDVIAVISDGINSFRKANNDPIPWTDLVDEFTGYKTTEGEFVLRRISAFKRKCLKEGITHFDDISISAIVV